MQGAYNSNRCAMGQTSEYERANANYNVAKQYGVRLRYILGRLLAHVLGLQSTLFGNVPNVSPTCHAMSYFLAVLG